MTRDELLDLARRELRMRQPQCLCPAGWRCEHRMAVDVVSVAGHHFIEGAGGVPFKVVGRPCECKGRCILETRARVYCRQCQQEGSLERGAERPHDWLCPRCAKWLGDAHRDGTRLLPQHTLRALKENGHE